MQLEFDEQKWTAPNRPNRPDEKGIIGLLIRWGVVKNKAQANMLMLGLIVVLCIISYVALSSL